MLESLGDVFGTVVTLAAAVIAVTVAWKKKKQQAADEAQPAHAPALGGVDAKQEQPMRSHYSEAMPAAKPPRIPSAPAVQPGGSLKYVSPEGVEMHEAGFHGRAPARPDRVPAAVEAKHKKQPQEAVRPMYAATQLRDAFIMKEILDAPVSRRQGVKRTYGR